MSAGIADGSRTDEADHVTTPRTRDVLRRWPFWIVMGVIVIVAATIWAMVGGAAQQGIPLSPANPAPAGAQALAQVLRTQGVEVVEPERLDAATAQAPGATLLLHDPDGVLGEGALKRLAAAGAARLVLLDPAPRVLATLAPDVEIDGTTSEPATADCALGAVQRAGTVAGEAVLYRVTGDARACWGGPDGHRVALVDGGALVVVGTTGAFSNEQIVMAGNAAFSLGLLGERDRLVWYRPTLLDADGTAPPTVGSLSPPWVIAFTGLMIAVFIAAAVWRGRRFGPLVVEPLPAVVRSDETVRGRARLYARADARLRALDALRRGSLDRLAAALALPMTADVDEIVAAVAAVTGRSPARLRALLRDAEPRGDRELVRLARDLRELEDAVDRAAHGPGE